MGVSICCCYGNTLHRSPHFCGVLSLWVLSIPALGGVLHYEATLHVWLVGDMRMLLDFNAAGHHIPSLLIHSGSPNPMACLCLSLQTPRNCPSFLCPQEHIGSLKQTSCILSTAETVWVTRDCDFYKSTYREHIKTTWGLGGILWKRWDLRGNRHRIHDFNT